jgi:hypothetical protein
MVALPYCPIASIPLMTKRASCPFHSLLTESQALALTRNKKSVFVVSLDSPAKTVQIPVCLDILNHDRWLLIMCLA